MNAVKRAERQGDYARTGTVEVLAGNGYTLTEGPLIDMLTAAIEG